MTLKIARKHMRMWLGLFVLSFLFACQSPTSPPVTSPPTLTESPIPSETSSPVKTPDPTPTVQVLEEESCPTIPEGVCNYLYLPAIEGYEQTFRVKNLTTGEESTEERNFRGVKSEAADTGSPSTESFGYDLISGDMTTNITVYCLPDGLISNEVQAMSEKSAPGMQHGGGSFRTLYVNYEGVTYKKDPAPGDTWTQSMEWVVEMEDSSIDQFMFKTVSNFTYVGIETVNVPAGTFRAQRIDMDMVMKLGPLFSGNTFFQLASIPVTASSWNAECVGMVKYIYNAMDEEKVTELIEYSFP